MSRGEATRGGCRRGVLAQKQQPAQDMRGLLPAILQSQLGVSLARYVRGVYTPTGSAGAEAAASDATVWPSGSAPMVPSRLAR